MHCLIRHQRKARIAGGGKGWGAQRLWDSSSPCVNAVQPRSTHAGRQHASWEEKTCDARTLATCERPHPALSQPLSPPHHVLRWKLRLVPRLVPQLEPQGPRQAREAQQRLPVHAAGARPCRRTVLRWRTRACRRSASRPAGPLAAGSPVECRWVMPLGLRRGDDPGSAGIRGSRDSADLVHYARVRAQK